MDEWTIADECRATLQMDPTLVSDAVRAACLHHLTGPPLPESVAHLADWWRSLVLGRPAGGMGVGAFTWPDVTAWMHNTGHSCATPFEVEALLEGDKAFIAMMSATGARATQYDPDTWTMSGDTMDPT